MDQQGLWHLPRGDVTPGHAVLAFSGAYGGVSVDYRRMAERGAVLVGRAARFQGGVMYFGENLAADLAAGDASCLAFCDQADAFASRQGFGLPDEPGARDILPDPACVTDPLRSLRLHDAKIRSVIWATGYALDFGWLKAPVFDERGMPMHRRGVTGVPGLYFLGLLWLSKRTSSFICGVGDDAAFLAEHIASSV
jgi:putative flavoprotein involved in K+ transport